MIFQLRKQINDDTPVVISTGYKYSDLKNLKSDLEKSETNPVVYYWITPAPPVKKEVESV